MVRSRPLRACMLAAAAAASGLVLAFVDRGTFEAGLPLAPVLLAAAALGAVGLGVRRRVRGRLARAGTRLRASVEAVGEGATIDPPETGIRELDRVGDVLASVSARLAGRTAALLAANRALERDAAERTRELADQADLIHATLENLDQGLLVIDAHGEVPIFNQRALALLDLSPEFMAARPNLETILLHQIEQERHPDPDKVWRHWLAGGALTLSQRTFERERPNGVTLEVRTVPLPGGGAVRTYTDVTALKRSERRSHHMARHDELTDLPNRTFFRERLGACFDEQPGSGAPFALLCLDLDRFKAVNDTLGHPAGDQLLRLAAERIRAAIPEGAVVARLGGDEFAVIQRDVAMPEAAETLARRLLACMDEPFTIDGQAIGVGVSVGIAVAPRDGRDGDVLFKSADLALYRAKQEGRNGYRFFDDAMDEAQRLRRALGLGLQQALDRQEFELLYQPVVNLRDHAIAGFEALVRWRHPERGLLGPAEFIPLCEELRFVIPLGSWVLKEACRQAASWPAGVRVSVNISAHHVTHPGLVPSVIAALGSAGLAPDRLEIEITETVLVRDSEPALAILQTLREFGIRIALDDFGTGHSSLAYLQRFPLDAIKIDQSFVAGRDERSGAIVTAMTALGRGLSMAVTAEGVETTEQLDRVRRAGCTEAQGFLFGAPMAAAAAAELLRARERVRLA